MLQLKKLIVEDDFLNRNFLGKIASAYGQVEMAVDGREAVKRSYEAKEPYSLIFLDILMPGLDGQETLKRIRAYEEEAGILGSKTCKVIMTTALGDSENVIDAFNSQCDAYITKPYTVKTVEEQVEKIFPGAMRRGSGEHEGQP